MSCQLFCSLVGNHVSTPSSASTFCGLQFKAWIFTLSFSLLNNDIKQRILPQKRGHISRCSVKNWKSKSLLRHIQYMWWWIHWQTLTLFALEITPFSFFWCSENDPRVKWPDGSMMTRRAAYLQQTVATAALSQGFGGGWDHVLLLFSHSQCELEQHTSKINGQGSHFQANRLVRMCILSQVVYLSRYVVWGMWVIK